MYIVKHKLHCLLKSSIDDLSYSSDYNDLEQLNHVVLKTNNTIMFLGIQKVKKIGANYSVIMNGKSLYYTYNPILLQDHVNPL